MQAHGRVLVGATFDRDRLIKPTPLLLDAKVHYGYVEKIVDEDFIIRRSYLARAYKMNLAGSDGFTALDLNPHFDPVAAVDAAKTLAELDPNSANP